MIESGELFFSEQTLAQLEEQRRFLIRQAAETNVPNPGGLAIIDQAIADASNRLHKLQKGKTK